MQRVGIKNAAERAKAYPHQFSGGQRQRLMIAMALGWDPDILIADEPTTALDVTVQAEILRLLGKLRDETGMGLLMITHDLGVVAEMADRVLVMNAGEMVETGETRAVFRSPEHPYTRRLLSAVPGQGSIRTDAVADEAPILEVRNLEKYYGTFHALKGISFDLRAGETVGIVGEFGLGQVDRRARHPAPRRARRRRGDLPGPRPPQALRPRGLRAPARDPDGVPGPDAVAQPAHDGLPARLRGLAHPSPTSCPGRSGGGGRRSSSTSWG